MALLLYAPVAALVLWLAHRFVRPLSRWAALILFLLPFVLGGHALIANRVWAPIDLSYQWVPLNWMHQEQGVSEASTGIHSDVYSQFIPWRKAVQWSLARGEWGLWNRFLYAGDVLLASEQPAVFSPITLLACLLPAAMSFTFTGAITLLIAAVTAFLFARELGCREGAALAAAAGWAFCNSFVLFLLVALAATWSWAALVFLGVRRVARRPDARSASLLGVSFAMMLVSAHSESALLIVVLAMFYGIFELTAHRATAIRAALLAMTAGAAALLVNAIHLLPFLEAVPWTMEYSHRDTIFRFVPRGVPSVQALARMASTFFPWLHGRNWTLSKVAPPSYVTGAVGSIVLGLAIYALWRIRSRDTWFFGGIFAFALIAGAEVKVLARLLAHVPLLDIALFDRFSIGVAFALSILAAMAVEEVCRRGGDRAAAWTLAVCLLVIAAGNAWMRRSALVSQEDMHFGAHVMFAEIAMLALAALLFTQRRALIPGVLALIIAQRALSVGDVQRSFPPHQAYPPIPILEPLETMNIRSPFRIVGHGRAFVPGTSTMYELADVRGYSAMTLLRYRETYSMWCIEQPVWSNRVDDLTRPFLSFLNVRFAITWDREPPPPGWREVSRQKGSMLIENLHVLERAFVPRNVHVGDAAGSNLMQMALATDFADRAWIEERGPAYDRQNGPGTTVVRDARLGFLIDADMERDGWVVTSLAAWPGWRAYVDGKQVKTRIANHAFTAVYVPAGRHRIRMKYWPQSFVAGRAITAGTLLAVIAFWVLLHRRQALLQRRDPALAPLPLGE